MDQPPTPRMMPSMPPMPIDAQTPLPVTLTAEEWNVVQHALHEAAMPMRLSRPVSDRIAQQTQAAARELRMPPMSVMPGARDARLSE